MSVLNLPRKEYDALMELEDLQQSLSAEGRIGKPAEMKKAVMGFGHKIRTMEKMASDG